MKPVKLKGQYRAKQTWLRVKMIGIYQITNKVNGKRYVGQSKNIKNRFAQHKSANCNTELHRDIKQYGKNNFEFKVLIECSEEDLRANELRIIKETLPEYNIIGNPLCEEEWKKTVSQKSKNWWNRLSEEEKSKIINENLKGPKVGHEVSDETRKKISKKVSEVQKQKVICLETQEIFNSIGEFENYVGACTGTCASYWKGKIKSVKGYHVEKV